MTLADASCELLIKVGKRIALYKSRIMSADHGKALDRVASFLPTATVSAFQVILSSYPQSGGCTPQEVILQCNRPVEGCCTSDAHMMLNTCLGHPHMPAHAL